MFDPSVLTSQQRRTLIESVLTTAFNVTIYAEQFDCSESEIVDYLKTQGVRECLACGQFYSREDFSADEVMCNRCLADIQ